MLPNYVTLICFRDIVILNNASFSSLGDTERYYLSHMCFQIVIENIPLNHYGLYLDTVMLFVV